MDSMFAQCLAQIEGEAVTVVLGEEEKEGERKVIVENAKYLSSLFDFRW